MHFMDIIETLRQKLFCSFSNSIIVSIVHRKQGIQSRVQLYLLQMCLFKQVDCCIAEEEVVIFLRGNSIIIYGMLKDVVRYSRQELEAACKDQWTGYLELYFQKQVADLARLNHDNAGKLLGYCRESSPFTRMLVFEYASKGTLYEHLHYGEGCQLSWTR